MQSSNVFVSLPLDDLIAFQQAIDDYKHTLVTVQRLEREIDGLRGLYSQVLILLGRK